MFTAHFHPGLKGADCTVIEAEFYSHSTVDGVLNVTLKHPLPDGGTHTYPIAPTERVYFKNSKGNQIEFIEGRAVANAA